MVKFCRLVFFFGFFLVSFALAFASPPDLLIDNFASEQNRFGGKRGSYARAPSAVQILPQLDSKLSELYLKIVYQKEGISPCGFFSTLYAGTNHYSYIKSRDENLLSILYGGQNKYLDASSFEALVFEVKGELGGEKFEIGLMDDNAEKLENPGFAGTIYNYLPERVSKNWKKVIIPTKDFEKINLSNLARVIINFEEPGKGSIYLKNLTLMAVLPAQNKSLSAGNSLLIDDFDRGRFNALGGISHGYMKQPSCISWERISTSPNQVLRIDFDKKADSWCGYYTRLNKGDKFLDATKYKNLTFDVKGEGSQLEFELGLADEKWERLQDSLKAGTISAYLPLGVNKDWQTVSIPLFDFGPLDYSKLASLVFNFYLDGQGTVFVDNLRLE